jgi:NAD(P)-dependent dehydrogenase (short-subunit alcohol dehydrogenase family)
MKYLITGANRGIGLELTRQLLGRGDQVFAATRQPDSASELQALKKQYGDHIQLIALDVSDPVSIAASYAVVRQQTDSLDVLINNAGLGGNEPLGAVTQEKLIECYKVNAAGPILMAQQYLDLLKAGTAKKIVNLTTGISSIGTRDWGGMYSYTASKAALNMLNKNLSLDVTNLGIVSIVIDPGWVKTDMGGPNAWITPEESVNGILKVADNLTMVQTGKFFHYSGSEVPW